MHFLGAQQTTLWVAISLQLTGMALAFDLGLKPPTTCIMERTKRMLAYSCINLRLKEVPQYMKSGVEIIWLTDNRIRDLSLESFSKYGSLKYLYINENMVQTVEEGTFAQLPNLEVIDLSSNALTTIPLEIFQLTQLRNLYVADNNLFHLEADLKNLPKPIPAPLQIISLSACKLQMIPDFGVLPQLLHANFSLNPMTQVAAAQLAPMCHLKTIDLSKTTMQGCSCHRVQAYLDSTAVYIKNGPIFCDTTGGECSPEQPSNATQQLHGQCLATREAQVKSSMMIYGAIGAVVAAVLLLLCCCCIRNRKIARQRKEQKKAAAARRAKKRKEAAEKRLMNATEAGSDANLFSSDSEKGAKDSDNGVPSVVKVDIEKAPPGVS